MNKIQKTRWGKAIQSKDVQHDLKRMAILKTAARLFNQQGFRETSLNDLADELQVTKPTLYYYIENKEDILFQCLLTSLTDLLENVDEIQNSELAGVDKLIRFIHVFTAVLDDEFGRCMSHPGPEPLSEKYLSQIDPLYVQLNTASRNIVEGGVKDGTLKPCNPKIATFSMLGSINWMTRWYQIGGEMTTKEVAEEMVAMFVHGLAS